MERQKTKEPIHILTTLARWKVLENFPTRTIAVDGVLPSLSRKKTKERLCQSLSLSLSFYLARKQNPRRRRKKWTREKAKGERSARAKVLALSLCFALLPGLLHPFVSDGLSPVNTCSQRSSSDQRQPYIRQQGGRRWRNKATRLAAPAFSRGDQLQFFFGGGGLFDIFFLGVEEIPAVPDCLAPAGWRIPSGRRRLIKKNPNEMSCCRLSLIQLRVGHCTGDSSGIDLK